MRVTPSHFLNPESAHLSQPARVRRRVARLRVIIFLVMLLPASVTPAQQRCRQLGRMYSIQLDDPIEAALIGQELKIKPVMVVGQQFYYFGDATLNDILRRYGYSPVRRNAADVLTRVVRMAPAKDAEGARRAGFTVLIREPRYWIVRVTLKQSEALTRRGYNLRALENNALHPRQIKITTQDFKDVQRAASLDVDVYSVRQAREGFIIEGGAFDDTIEKLRSAGLAVEILADPPGVIR